MDPLRVKTLRFKKKNFPLFNFNVRIFFRSFDLLFDQNFRDFQIMLSYATKTTRNTIKKKGSALVYLFISFVWRIPKELTSATRVFVVISSADGGGTHYYHHYTAVFFFFVIISLLIFFVICWRERINDVIRVFLSLLKRESCNAF